MRKIALASALLCLGIPAFADVSLTDRTTIVRTLSRDSVASDDTPESRAKQRAANLAKKAAKRAKRGDQADATIGTNDVPLARQQLHAANLAKKAAKAAKRGNHAGTIGTTSTRPVTEATGSISLIDASGLEYFINTNITFSTSSSASGAASEATYTAATNATTIGGGFTTSTLTDAFDGYNSLCVSLTNATGPCVTGNPAYTIYNQNGAPTLDASCSNRQVLFPTQVIGGLNVSRKVLVPTDDEYMRWLNTFTNTTGAPITFTMITGNNLGSDSNTIIVSSDSGDAIATTTDTWVTTMQNYTGVTSPDVRLGHVLRGDGAVDTPLSGINFVNGDDNPYWSYSITLAAGETKSILNFVTGQPTKALAATEAERLSQLLATASQCLTPTELTEVANFVTVSNSDLSILKTTATTTVYAGQPISYTITVTNGGPDSASNVTVTDTLPAGATFVSATGTGWTCNNLLNVVTCTLPTLAVGPAAPITLTMLAPTTFVTTTLTNTASVTSDSIDSTPANDSSTSPAAALFPAIAAPALSPMMLALLALALAATAWIVMSRRM